MISRPSIAAIVAFAMLATLTLTAFAVSLPAMSAPQAHDLPRIVSEAGAGPASPATAAAGASAVTSATGPARAAGTPHTPPSSGSGQSGTSDARSSGNTAAGPDHPSNPGPADHEVVEPKIHESGEGNGANPSQSHTNSTHSNGSRLSSILDAGSRSRRDGGTTH